MIENKWTDDVERMIARQAYSGERLEGLFLGSSVFRLWRLAKYFPDRRFLNRAFGGACLTDLLHFYDHLSLGLKTQQIVIYAGDNDLAEGISPEGVHELTVELVYRLRRDHITSKIVLLPMKPSAMRWHLREDQLKVKELNRQIDHVHHVPTLDMFLNEKGEPDQQYLLSDGLHLNDLGYTLMTGIVSPYL